MSQLFLFVRLPKQFDQIFQLVDEFHNDTSYPVSMAVDECWIYTGDVAGVHELLLCSDLISSFVSFFSIASNLSKCPRIDEILELMRLY